MNRWLAMRRLRGPAFLILFGVTALLNQEGILSFGRSWPLYLILCGLLMLAERAAMTEPTSPGIASIHVTPMVPVSALDRIGDKTGAEIDSSSDGGKWGA